MSAPSPAQQWDSRYNTEVFQYGTEPNDFLKAHLARLANATSILCLAEGEGRNALAVLKATKENAKVTCIDLSKVGLEKAEKLFAQNGVAASRYETVVADLAEYDIGTNKWDAIVSIWCHVPEGMRKGLHARVVKGLKEKGGLLILEAYTPKQLEFKTGGPPVAMLMMSEAALRAELDGLSMEICHEIEREVHEGPLHDGHSAVVQVLGSKL